MAYLHRDGSMQQAMTAGTCGSWEAHVGGLHGGWQQGKDLIPGSLGVAIQVDGNLDLVRTDSASNVRHRPG